MVNHHEHAARARKVIALTAAIDSVYDALHDVPSARDVRGFTPVIWSNLARLAKVNAPSAETIALVAKHFEGRESQRRAG